MAYNDDALKSKLSTLNETQESIVSVSQWITFHRRYADRIAQVWLARLKDVPPPKRLNFIYLVNDIVQNAKARKRTEFPNAFSPIIAEAVQQAYRSSTPDIQNKIKRVVEVWQTRNVFEDSILNAVHARIDDVDKTKGTAGKGKKLIGNSLFSPSGGPSIPKELESLGPLQTAVNKAEFTTRPLVETAQSEYTKVYDQTVPQPSAPVHAASLSSLIKKLASAEAGLNESITARKALIADLQRLINAAGTALANDEEAALDLSAKRTTAETTKRDVEDSIMRGLAENPDDEDGDATAGQEYNRPDVEELTPEPEEEIIAPPVTSTESVPSESRNPNLQGILAGFGGPSDSAQHSIPEIPGSPPLNYPSTTNGNGPSSSKKRKLSHDPYSNNEASVPDLGAMGVTAFDGTIDSPVALAATTAASRFPPSTVVHPAMHYHPTQPLFAEQPADVANLMSTLEEDVDALIRSSSRNADPGAAP